MRLEGAQLQWRMSDWSGKLKVYIVTEIMSRELIGNLMLAALLAERGHVAIVLNQEDSFVLGRGSVSGTTIFHTKSLHYAEERISQHKELRADGFIITSMDQETSMLNPGASEVLSRRFCKENLEVAARVYTWSQFEMMELSKLFPTVAEKFTDVGSPRMDLWSPRFRGLGGLLPETRRRILLTPSVILNSSVRHWDHMAIAKSVSHPANPLHQYHSESFEGHAYELRSQVFFSKLALKIADEFPDCDVILQPKKNEIKEAWVRSLYSLDTTGDGSRPNIYIEYSRILEESIHGSDVVVNSNSTAGLTALLGRVPLVSFGPTESIASQLGARVDNIEKGFARVIKALADPEGFMSSYEAKNLKMLGDRISVSGFRLAGEKIAEDMENFDSGIRSGLTVRDYLLYLYPGTIRRFFGVLKSMMRLRPAVLAHPEKVAKISQERADELLTKIVDGIGRDLKVKAVVAGARNIVVTPNPQSKK